MALYYNDVDGTLVIPGAPANWRVAPSASGTSTTGVVVLFGEAESGPSYADEDIVASAGFGLNSKAAVEAKFGSGRLVDAYVNACAPSKDAAISGGPSRIYLVKTNTGDKAEKQLTGAYATLIARAAGKPGNLINVTVSAPVDGVVPLRIARAMDNKVENFSIGGNVVLKIRAKSNTYPTAALALTQNGTSMTTATPVAASGTATLNSVQVGDKLTLNLVDFTAVAANPTGNEFIATADNTETATNLKNAINASQSVGVKDVLTATSLNAVVTVTADVAGFEGNDHTFTKTGASITLSPGAGKLAGGVWPVSEVASLNITLANFLTLGDLAAYINTQTGWTAVVPGMFTQVSPSAMDRLNAVDVKYVAPDTYTEVKKDAYEFVQAIGHSTLVAVKTAPTTGLPSAENTFLAGGARGPTLAADITAALVQIKRLSCNFIVPLFSNDASADISALETDGSSTYTISGINAGLATHVSECSQFKNRKPRQGFVSLSDTFANQKTAAQTMGAFRMSMAFEDVLALGADGLTHWYQPWMGATFAAAMQAACSYRPIFNKAINLYGCRSPRSDFVVEDTGNLEDAIMNGLLVVAPRQADGAMSFVSDQTTYGVDNNFCLNSIQVIYASDVIAQTSSQKMEVAFSGQSFADVSASVALSFLQDVFAELRRLKWMGSSSDAPAGYRNASVTISAPAMVIGAEVIPASGVYFQPIHIVVRPSTSTASA